jgi:hypothetical protein
MPIKIVTFEIDECSADNLTEFRKEMRRRGYTLKSNGHEFPQNVVARDISDNDIAVVDLKEAAAKLELQLKRYFIATISDPALCQLDR